MTQFSGRTTIVVLLTFICYISKGQNSRIWSTYYGDMFNDFTDAVATDDSGNVFIAGNTGSMDSIAMNGHQMTNSGGGDAFLVKFNSAGVRQWGTYYGGLGGDFGYALATDRFGNVFLAGTTSSQDNIAANGHQNQPNGFPKQAFLVKFNSNGVRQWATYYGGVSDNEGLGCTTDNDGNIYLSGYTKSPTDIAFNGFQNSHSPGGNEDAFLVKFDSSGTRLWATYYGDSGHDRGYSCVTDDNGNVYMCGVTESDSIIAFNGHQNSRGGMTDAFMVKFDSAGNRLWATYYGGSLAEFAYFCSADVTGNIIMAGYTSSASGIAAVGHQNSPGGQRDAFLVKFDSAGTRQWGTYYGGHLDEFGIQCSADDSGNVYLSGSTLSPANIAFNGFLNTYNDHGVEDAFLARFDPNGLLIYGTYYGGNSREVGNVCAADKYGNVYMAGTTYSDSGLAYNGHQSNFAGLINDAYLVKFNVHLVTGVTENFSGNSQLLIYPNPVSEQPVVISTSALSESGDCIVTIYDLSGRIVHSERVFPLHGQAVIRYWNGRNSGVYELILQSQDNRSRARLVVKNF